MGLRDRIAGCAPVRDALGGLRESVRSLPDLVAVGLAYVACWFVYAPLHELLHALACVALGGAVTRVELGEVYGAAWLQRVFPQIEVVPSLGGRIAGFDTHGSDAVYLATDAGPFVLTVLAGIPLLRATATRSWPQPWRALAFGAALPVAFAPFESWTGDYYEMGSIVVSRAILAIAPAFDVTRWRSDDLPHLVAVLFPSVRAINASDLLGITAAGAVGVALSAGTYALGVAWARFALERKSRHRQPAPA